MLLFQQLPSLPANVKSEGTTAILWLVGLGVALVLALAIKGPAIVTAWRLAGNGKEAVRVDRLLSVLEANTKANERKAAAVAELTSEIKGLRAELHDRHGPALSGLSLAYLRLKGLGLAETADQMEADEKARGFPPARKP